VRWSLLLTEALAHVAGMNELEDALRRSYPDALLVIDRRGIVREALCGTDVPLFVDDPRGEKLAQLWPPPIVDNIVQVLRKVLKSRRTSSCSISLPKPGGDEINCECRFLVHGRDSILMLLRDSTTISTPAKSVEALPDRDSETGLYNRRWFIERAADRFNEARLREEQAAVLIIEFPEIDSINATFGRRVGGELMKVAVQRIGSKIRHKRDPSQRDEVALIARDALGLLVSPVHSREQVTSVASRIREALDGPFGWEGREFTLKSGLGAAMFPRDGEDVDVLLRNAHMALNEAAFSRMSGAVFYSDTMPVRSLARLDVQEELRVAIEQGQLSMRYTPWVRTEPTRIGGLEVDPVLLSPIRGELPCERLISYAEATGLASVLFQQTFEAALSTVPKLLGEPSHGQRPRLQLNMQISQMDPDLPADVASRCRRHGVSASQVYLTFPESVLLQEDLVEILSRLRKQSVRVVLRDFGAEQVRLAGLAAQPLWGVQLADTLVRGLKSSAGQRTCAAVTQLARTLELSVLAPEVGRAREAQLLEQYGCTALSGPLYGVRLSQEQLSASVAEPLAEGRPAASGEG
jgi:diguanylate cyclase (GGDEF)-like protein